MPAEDLVRVMYALRAAMDANDLTAIHDRADAGRRRLPRAIEQRLEATDLGRNEGVSYCRRYAMGRPLRRRQLRNAAIPKSCSPLLLGNQQLTIGPKT